MPVPASSQEPIIIPIMIKKSIAMTDFFKLSPIALKSSSIEYPSFLDAPHTINRQSVKRI
jgi:hypothetical protein